MPLSASQRESVHRVSVGVKRVLAKYAYGTSGFRGLATTLDAVTLRMGMLAVLRSWHRKGLHLRETSSSDLSTVCPAVGLMVTASHNEGHDNGVKLVDYSGEMLEQSWELIATRLANAKEEEVDSVLDAITSEHNIDSSLEAHVFIARDTRDSSPHLNDLVIQGAKALGAQVHDFGIGTTPQLHWVVREHNAGRTATFEAYYSVLTNAFKDALQFRSGSSSSASSSSAASTPQLSPLTIDCAHGVGAKSLTRFTDLLTSTLPITLRNTGGGGLNLHCGAEHVQKCRAIPAAFDANTDSNKKLASVDGDADRLVYFYINDKGQFRLLDGDKIIALYTLFLRQQLKRAGLDSHLSIGIVQTAYANGASTLYMRNELGVDVQFTNTGVKHLHHKAVEYDIGVYFESNGHGTVVFSQKAQKLFRSSALAAATDSNKESLTAAKCLNALLDLINQCVGDAVSDMLLVEVALFHLGWSLSDWDAVYEDLPSLMLKVNVKDRSVITTTDAERVCVTPAGLQDAINALVNTGNEKGVRRAFVRPSGTEDIVRVYAEAATPEETKILADQVCQATAKLAGGL